ncbi:MAG: hypothetical protein LBB05_01975 [Puniceicoccales bacterium]|jgi:hypothetical protein|nr:hypothetical protein [Puniceicoccales bacterium]
MRIWKNVLGVTLLEFLVAGAITVAIAVSATVGINTLLDHKKNENTKPKLAYEAFQILNEIEKNFDNRSSSLGNLLINERTYPFQFQVNGPVNGYPSLSFFINSPEGPRAICYSLAPLPSAINVGSSGVVGIFKHILDVNDSATVLENFSLGNDLVFNGNDVAKVANLVSELVVCFEVHLIRLANDGFSLEYLNKDAQIIKMYAGKWTLGASFPTDVTFIEIMVGLLPKSLHGSYFALASSADKKSFIAKNGIQLTRILPWNI